MSSSPDSRGRRVGLVSIPLLALGVSLMVYQLGIAAPAAAMFGVVILMAAWWVLETLPLALTAALPLVLFPLFDIASPLTTLLAYLDPVNFLYLGGMWIAASMQQWGLHRRLALGVVSRIGTEPRRLVLGFMVATAMVSLWISNTATAMMMFPIAQALLLADAGDAVANRRPEERRFAQALMLGVAYAASIGGLGTKIGTAPNLVYVRQAEALGHEVDFFTWMSVGFPLVVILLPLTWWWLVGVATPVPRSLTLPGVSRLIAARGALGSMSRGEAVSACAFALAAFGWVFRKDIDLDFAVIPGWSRLWPWDLSDVTGLDPQSLGAPWSAILQRDLGDTWVSLIIGGALLLIPVSLRPFATALSPSRALGIPWHLLLLLGGGFALAEGIAASGLDELLSLGVAPLSALPFPLAVAAFATVTIVVSEVASNTATANILVPLIAASATTLDARTLPLMLAVTYASSFGFMLPAGTPPNALAYASGHLTVRDMVRAGLAIDIIAGLIITLYCGFIIAP